MKRSSKARAPEAGLSEKQRAYVSQTDIPAFSLSKALRIATAIADNYGKAPTKPLRVAQALEMSPTSSPFTKNRQRKIFRNFCRILRLFWGHIDQASFIDE